MRYAERLVAVARDRLLTAADTWERHLIVADLLGDARQVVDVGGLPGQLRAFLPGASVLAANVSPPADLIVPEDRLPFETGSIEAVTSLDALEHVPRELRAGFVAELVRVAARRVVLCCPLGSDQHVAAEREVELWYEELVGEGWLVGRKARAQCDRRRLQARGGQSGRQFSRRNVGDSQVDGMSRARSNKAHERGSAHGH